MTDSRKRPANKRFRARSDNGHSYQTISLCLHQDIISFIENKIADEPDNNFSVFIEREITQYVEKKKIIVTPIEKKHAYGSGPIKKTFTFSPDFVFMLDKSGNRSLFVETMLRKKFNL